MTYTLVTFQEIMEIPVTPEGFLRYVELARLQFNRAASNFSHNDSTSDLEISFMSQVSSAALQYGIDEADKLDFDGFYSTSNGDEYADFRQFDRILHSIETRMQIALARQHQAKEFALTDSDKSKIHFHVQQLRERIDSSDLPEATKTALHRKLDELLGQLNGKRVNLAATLVIISGVLTAIGIAESDAIQLPKAVAAIGRVIGEAKEHHDINSPAPKKLGFQPVGRAAAVNPAPAPRESFSADLDDEIPF